MGVEYQHYLFAKDLNHVGTIETAMAIDSVLADWGLISGASAIRSLDGDKSRKLRFAELEKIHPVPTNLLVEYPFTEACAISEIMGPSHFENVETRYFQQIAILIGSDFRTYNGLETAFTTVTASPRNNGVEVLPYKPNFDISFYSEAFPADKNTEPPSAILESDYEEWPLPDDFNGIWRCGIILDCGKDLPAFRQKTNKLPSSRFVADIEKAMGSRVVQIGHFY